MIRQISVAFMLLIALLGACGGSSDEDEIRRLLQREVDHLNERNYKAIYELLPPSRRETCDFETFRSNAAVLDIFVTILAGDAKLSIENLEVLVEGDVGRARYITKAGDEIIAETTDEDPDIWVREDGAWWDEDEDETFSCGEPSPVFFSERDREPSSLAVANPSPNRRSRTPAPSPTRAHSGGDKIAAVCLDKLYLIDPNGSDIRLANVGRNFDAPRMLA